MMDVDVGSSKVEVLYSQVEEVKSVVNDGSMPVEVREGKIEK